MQEAIDSLRGVWGAVEFWGTIPITSRLFLYPGIALRGAGPLSAFSLGSSVIKVSHTFDNPIITCLVDPDVPANKFFPYLENFTINGGGFTSTNTLQDGIRIDGLTGPAIPVFDTYIHHVSVFNAGGNGLNVLKGPSTKVWVDDVYFEVSGQNGILMNGGVVRVNNAYIYGNELFGIDADGAGLLQVGPGCALWNNGRSAGDGLGGGIRVRSVGTGCIIKGATFLDSGGPSNPTILLSSLPGQNQFACIEGCKFSESRASGVKAVNHIGSGVLPIRADIRGNTFTGQGGAAINIAANPLNVVFIRDNPGYNPVGYISPDLAVGASPWSYANTDYVDLDFRFTTTGGDTISSITKGGQLLPLLSPTDSGLLPVQATESLVITYAHLFGSQSAKRWGH